MGFRFHIQILASKTCWYFSIEFEVFQFRVSPCLAWPVTRWPKVVLSVTWSRQPAKSLPRWPFCGGMTDHHLEIIWGDDDADVVESNLTWAKLMKVMMLSWSVWCFDDVMIVWWPQVVIEGHEMVIWWSQMITWWSYLNSSYLESPASQVQGALWESMMLFLLHIVLWSWP